jgi:hypothetical protein
VRRLIDGSGFFGMLQKSNRDFLVRLARMGLPADHLVLTDAFDVMRAQRRARKPRVGLLRRARRW